MAAGMIGTSQAYGNDDEVSRDHGWGGLVMLWLPGELCEEPGRALQTLVEGLPRTFDGHPACCQLCRFDQLLERTVGCSGPPERLLDWLRIPEQYLFEVAYAPVFYDPGGEVTQRLRAFGQYPEDVRLHRLCAHLEWLAEWGLKHLTRTERRGDEVTAALQWSRFSVQAMQVGFALSGRYAPYHKWLWREFSKLPAPCGQVASLLQEGFSLCSRSDVVREIVQVYRVQLDRLGYIPAAPTPEQMAKMAYPETAELLSYVRAIRAEIADEDIRALGGNLVLLMPAFRPPPYDGW
ncbi:MAG: DUF4037 domain-containing protein [Armatimonadia bacterium]